MEKQRIVERITNVKELTTSPLERAYAFLLNIVGYILLAIAIGTYFLLKYLWENKEIVIAIVSVVIIVLLYLRYRNKQNKQKNQNNENQTDKEPELPFDAEETAKKDMKTRDYERWRPPFEG